MISIKNERYDGRFQDPTIDTEKSVVSALHQLLYNDVQTRSSVIAHKRDALLTVESFVLNKRDVTTYTGPSEEMNSLYKGWILGKALLEKDDAFIAETRRGIMVLALEIAIAGDDMCFVNGSMIEDLVPVLELVLEFPDTTITSLCDLYQV